MRKMRKMRMLSGRERDKIREYLLQLKVDISLLEGSLLGIGRKVFLVNEEVLKVTKELQRKTGELYAVGVEIGTLSEEFEPSIGLSDLISSTEEKTVVNEEGEKLFSYGRDVFVQNIVKGKKEGDRLVVNERGEVLGFGFYDGKMLKNVVDKGFYVRGRKGRRR